MPLALVGGDGAAHALKQTPASVLARITGARKGVIIDGLLDDDVCDRLIRMIEQSAHVVTPRGVVNAVRTSAAFELPAERRWIRGAADQSNSVAFLGDRYVLKLFRRIEPAPHPEYEVGRFLAAAAFSRIPPLAGALEHAGNGDAEPSTLAVVQGLVKNQGSGWNFTLGDLRRYYERVSTRRDTREPLEQRDGGETRERAGPPAPVVVARVKLLPLSRATPGPPSARPPPA